MGIPILKPLHSTRPNLFALYGNTGPHKSYSVMSKVVEASTCLHNRSTC